MTTDAPTPLLGGLTQAQFMRRHWHKQALLVRGAVGHARGLLRRDQLFELAARDDVRSRLVMRRADQWTLRHGPLRRRSLPPLAQPGWTLLVQAVDLHVPAVQALLAAFRFIPHARLDDAMFSHASPGGGVGPHVDSYDVFLLQTQGLRRWRWGAAADASLVEDLPLKILKHFEPQHEAVLAPGDMLYLPPGVAHEGTAVEGECQTCSIGFRAPSRGELVRELLSRLADADGADDAALYRDPSQAATPAPGRVPPALRDLAARTVERAVTQGRALDRVLGEYLSEPRPEVWFAGGKRLRGAEPLVLAAASRMLYDAHHVFLNGESWRATGADARLLRQLADRRALSREQVAAASPGARALLDQWCEAGWLAPAEGHGGAS